MTRLDECIVRLFRCAGNPTTCTFGIGHLAHWLAYSEAPCFITLDLHGVDLPPVFAHVKASSNASIVLFISSCIFSNWGRDRHATAFIVDFELMIGCSWFFRIYSRSRAERWSAFDNDITDIYIVVVWQSSPLVQVDHSFVKRCLRDCGR